MAFRFRNFPVYQEARRFICDVYLLAQRLPKSEQFELASQLRRAATSILLNLAEGSMRRSDLEFNRFISMAIGSVGEVVSILDICLDQKYITGETHLRFVVKCESIAKQLYGFSRILKPKT